MNSKLEKINLEYQVLEEELKTSKTKTEELEGQLELASAERLQLDSEKAFEEKYMVQLKQQLEHYQYLVQQNDQDRE